MEVWRFYKDWDLIAEREDPLWLRMEREGYYVTASWLDANAVFLDGEIYHLYGGPIVPGVEMIAEALANTDDDDEEDLDDAVYCAQTL